MLNSDQSVLNLLAIDDPDDLLWEWLIKQVDAIAEGRDYENEKVIAEEPFRSSMILIYHRNRVHVVMECFGMKLHFSWSLHEDYRGDKILSNFKTEEIPDGRPVEPIMQIKKPKDKTPLEKCPDCQRKTVVDDTCSRCGYTLKMWGNRLLRLPL